MKTMHEVPQLISRRRDVGRMLGCSESQVLKYERAGLLHRVKLPNVGDKEVRAARYSTEEAMALAKRLIQESRSSGNDAA